MDVQIFDAPSVTPGVNGPAFAPMLFIPNGTTDISFYERAFGACELRRFLNDDGSIHVSELTIENAVFHLHEPTANAKASNPTVSNDTTVVIGLFVADVYAVVAQAVAAGARVTSPVQDYDYGYRQADIVDPFGHIWQIQKAI